MTVEEAISGALALIGFGRATAKISAILEGRRQKLLASGGLTEVSGLISCHVSPVQSSRIDGLEEVRGIATEPSAQVTFR